jgi:D-lactate dehydrogenase (cytochrome)
MPVDVESLFEDLSAALGDRVSRAAAVRDHHSHGESYHDPGVPDVVAFPTSTEDVQAIARICATRRCPMVPFGAGTSLEGHVNAIRGGVSIDLRQMNRVLRISADDLDATVEAGVTRQQLDRQLRSTGLTFFLDPGADATIGGMASTRASGTTAVRYGTMREIVLGLRVVLADGRVITTGGRARKSSAGYDLTRLFVGAEGTLGIITEVTVRLQPRPEAVAAAVCTFPTVDAAVRTVISAIQLAIPLARAELLDTVQIRAINRHSKLDRPEAPTLFFEFHGASDREVDEQAQGVEELAREHGCATFERATGIDERARLWQARHDAYYAAVAMRPGSRALTTDVCVPISRLADAINETCADIDASPLEGAIVGHVGDGNFHVIFPLDPAAPEELEEAHRLAARMAERAQRMGGTCTGEHGVGMGKMEFLRAEHGEALDVMRSIKQALDPLNLMNPGKLIPA